MMRIFETMMKAANRVSIAICSISIVVMMVYGFIDVISRYVFDRPLYGTFEISQLLLATVVFLSFASCEAENRHMRVDFLTAGSTGILRTVLDSLTYLCGTVLSLYLAYATIAPAMRSWRISEHTDGIVQFPVYPVKMIVPIGFALLALQLALHLAEVLGGRRPSGVPAETVAD